MEQRFAGKTVIVTGAGSGIGEGCARRFAAEGANVVLAGRRQAKLHEVAADLEPKRTLTVVADVVQRGDVERLVAETVERFGGIDVLVANAGTAVMKPFEETTPEEWRTVQATNVDGYYHCVQLALPHLKRSQGSVIVTASVSGLGGDWGMSAYNASKGAVVNFTRALALELGQAGVRVNAVAPSLTESEMTAGILGDEAVIAKFKERMPLGRAATPADIAGPVAFLASDDARFVTGAILPVDGGVTASNGQPMLG